MDPIRAALMACKCSALVLLASGCLHPTRTLLVHPLAHANHQRRFYLVVRTLKEEEFVSDAYEHVAGLVFPSALDPSVKLVRLVAPGHDDQVELTLPAEQPFAVYALFTEPGETWKVLVTPPLVRRYHVVLDENRVTVRTQAPGLLERGR